MGLDQAECPNSYGTGHEVSLTDSGVCGYMGEGKGGRRGRHNLSTFIPGVPNRMLGKLRPYYHVCHSKASTYRLFGGGELSGRFQEVLRNARLVQTSLMHWHTGRSAAREHFPLPLTPVSMHPAHSVSFTFGILGIFHVFAARDETATRSSGNGVQMLPGSFIHPRSMLPTL